VRKLGGDTRRPEELVVKGPEKRSQGGKEYSRAVRAALIDIEVFCNRQIARNRIEHAEKNRVRGYSYSCFLKKTRLRDLQAFCIFYDENLVSSEKKQVWIMPISFRRYHSGFEYHTVLPVGRVCIVK
jgi:hypothetical protein